MSPAELDAIEARATATVAWVVAAKELEPTAKLRPDVLNLVAELRRLRALVAEQAEDAGLWFVAEHVTEAYLQGALRDLHRAIEGEAP
jgi:hypothetical protein